MTVLNRTQKTILRLANIDAVPEGEEDAVLSDAILKLCRLTNGITLSAVELREALCMMASDEVPSALAPPTPH